METLLFKCYSAAKKRATEEILFGVEISWKAKATVNLREKTNKNKEVYFLTPEKCWPELRANEHGKCVPLYIFVHMYFCASKFRTLNLFICC